MTHDARLGLALAIGSSLAFGLSGSLARGLFDAGWSPGAVVLLRLTIGALVVLPLGVASLAGRWHVLRQNAGLIVTYGALAVAGAQYCYFAAVQRMDVGPALLIEFTAPAAVVGWMWARHGQRPTRVTVAGAAIAAVGLVLVLDILTGVSLDGIGVAWALAAMIGCATYFVVNGNDTTGLPPLALAAGGLVVGAIGLGVLGLVGVLPLAANTRDVRLADATVAWWTPVLLLGIVTAGVPYVAGIAAGRRLGSRLVSFVSLLEVVAGVIFAWLLLDQIPEAIQLVGGAAILLGVVVVRFGETATGTGDSTTTADPEDDLVPQPASAASLQNP
jgi:drug/metabolite transporter (DMT)-like permease